jgi:hypothetical protein
VASLGLLMAWVATYLLRQSLPIELEFSIWKPQTLFSTPLLFSLDGITWPLLMGCMALMLVISLTLPSRDIVISVRERLTSLIYLCITSAAVLAGNILTVLTMWMFMDMYVLALGMRTADHAEKGDEIIRWFGKNLISIILLLLATVINLSGGGSVNFSEKMIGASSVVVILSSLLRMPIHSISLNGKKIGWDDSGMMSTLDIFPALSGFSVLGHILTNGIQADTVIWVRIIGGFCLVFSLFQSFKWMSKENSGYILTIGVFGLGVLVASFGAIGIGILLSALGVLIASLKVTIDYLPIHENWHTVVPILFVGMLAGLPGTLGGDLGSKTVNEIINSGSLGIAVLIWIGMGFFSGACLQRVKLVKQEWKNAEKITIISYAIGLIFLVLNAVVIGMETNQDVSIEGLIFFLSVAALTGTTYYTIGKLGYQRIRNFFIWPKIPQLRTGYKDSIKTGQFILQILSGIGSIFESETGLLWAFVILQFIILAIGEFGR